METLAQIAFIVVLPFVLVLGGLVTLFGAGAFFDAADNPGDLRERIDSAFRGAAGTPRPLSSDHYYQPYWRT
jgi:hypothetical protein